VSINSIKKVKKLKKLLENIAYASLIVDICISIVTLASLNLGRDYTTSVIFLLNYVLTTIVIVSLVVFVAIFMLSHYDKIAEKLSLTKRKTK